MFIIFSTAISSVFTPQIYNYVYEDDASRKLTALMIKVGRLQFYVVFFIWIGFVVLGKPFINLWAGADYGNAYIVGLLLMTPIVIALMQNVGIEILRAYNKHQMRTLLHLACALVNIIISIPLTKMYGEIGCAIGTCLSTFVSSTLIANYFYSKVINLDIKAFFKELREFIPAISILSVIGAGVLMFGQINNWLDLVFYSLVCTILYIVVMVRFAFNDYENALLNQLIAKIKGKLVKNQ